MRIGINNGNDDGKNKAAPAGASRKQNRAVVQIAKAGLAIGMVAGLSCEGGNSGPQSDAGTCEPQHTACSESLVGQDTVVTLDRSSPRSEKIVDVYVELGTFAYDVDSNSMFVTVNVLNSCEEAVRSESDAGVVDGDAPEGVVVMARINRETSEEVSDGKYTYRISVDEPGEDEEAGDVFNPDEQKVRVKVEIIECQEEPQTDGDADVDGDVDGDVDADGDVDGDVDADVDGDVDGDGDADPFVGVCDDVRNGELAEGEEEQVIFMRDRPLEIADEAYTSGYTGHYIGGPGNQLEISCDGLEEPLRVGTVDGEVSRAFDVENRRVIELDVAWSHATTLVCNKITVRDMTAEELAERTPSE